MNRIYKVDNNIDQMIRVLEEIQNIITSTLGPSGATSILYNGGYIPHVTKDGVSVAEFLKYDDPLSETINRIVKETARKTVETIGDGTTTSILLATTLTIYLLRNYPNLNKRRLFIETLESLIEKVLHDISSEKTLLTIFDDDSVISTLTSIAKISSNQDSEIVETISSVLKEIGPNGLIDVQQTNGEGISADIKSGVFFESKTSAIIREDLSNISIVLVENSIDKLHEFKRFMEYAHGKYKESKTSFIVVAKEFSLEIQNIVMINNKRGNFKVYLVENDAFGYTALEILNDVADIFEINTLSTNPNDVNSIQNLTSSNIGSVEKATITPSSLVLYTHGLSEKALKTKEELENKLNDLKSSGTASVGELSALTKRLAKLSNSALIRVGGATDVEAKEKTDRMEDAVKAISSAVNNGVLPGGGTVLYKISKTINNNAIKTMLEAPAKVLLKYSDIDLDALDGIIESGNVYDFYTNTAVDPFKYGLLDPADVTMKAVTQALAVAKAIAGSYSILVNLDDGQI